MASFEESMRDELIEAWQTNHRINLFLIEGISEEGLRSSLSTRGGRDVARQTDRLLFQTILETAQLDMARSLGARWALPKPVDAKRLLEAVEDVLAG